MQTEFARWKKLLAIAWPLIIANSFWNIQLTIDRIFLGMYSTEALGAAMAVMGVFWVPMALLQGTANYVMTFVAQYFGAEEKEKIGAAVWQAFYVSVVGGIGFLCLTFLSSWFFEHIVGHAPATRALEIEYFDSLTYTGLPTAIVAAISGFYTGLGRTRIVIGINLVGLLLNALLDYVMIFGNFGSPAFGVAGAGYATALATYGSAIYGAVLLFNKEHERIYRIFSDWRPKFDLLKQFLKYGLPSGMQWAFEGLAFTVFLILLGNFPNGEAALAASSISVTIMMLSVMPTMGVAQAVMTLVGQNLGDKNPAAAEQVTWDGVKISALYILVIASSFVIFPEFYLSWFKNEQNAALWAQVSALAPIILAIVGFFTMFDSIYLNISFALKGAGDTRMVSIIALSVPWPFMVLPTFFVKNFDHAVIWAWGFVALYSVVINGILLLRFRGGKWKSMSVIHS